MARITADWPASFRKLRTLLVSAQAALLQRLDWRVQLSLAREVAPSHTWLFGAGGGAGPRPAWADSMHSVCADIRQQVRLLAGAGGVLWPRGRGTREGVPGLRPLLHFTTVGSSTGSRIRQFR